MSDWLSSVDWLWKSLVARVVWFLLAAFFAWFIRRKKPETAEAVKYVLLMTACVAILWFAVTGRPILSPQQPMITEDNAEATVRKWLDSFGVSVRALTNDRSRFIYEVTISDGEDGEIPDKLEVTEFKPPGDKKLWIHSGMNFTGDTKQTISQLPAYDRDQIVGLLTIELSKTRVMFFKVDPQLRNVLLDKEVPITSALTEEVFLEDLQDVSAATILSANFVKAQLNLHLNSKPH
jgi:hypothetical protein